MAAGSVEETAAIVAGLIERYGSSVIDDPRRLRALVADHVGDRDQRTALLAAIDAGVAQSLSRQPGTPISRDLLVAHVGTTSGIDPEAAGWAVDVMATALGVRLVTAAQPAKAPPDRMRLAMIGVIVVVLLVVTVSIVRALDDSADTTVAPDTTITTGAVTTTMPEATTTTALTTTTAAVPTTSRPPRTTTTTTPTTTTTIPLTERAPHITDAVTTASNEECRVGRVEDFPAVMVPSTERVICVYTEGVVAYFTYYQPDRKADRVYELFLDYAINLQAEGSAEIMRQDVSWNNPAGIEAGRFLSYVVGDNSSIVYTYLEEHILAYVSSDTLGYEATFEWWQDHP